MNCSEIFQSHNWSSIGAPYDAILNQKERWLPLGADECRKMLDGSREVAFIILGAAILITGNKDVMRVAHTFILKSGEETPDYVNVLRLIHSQKNDYRVDREIIDKNLVEAMSFLSEAQKKKIYHEVDSECPADEVGIKEKEEFLGLLRVSLGV